MEAKLRNIEAKLRKLAQDGLLLLGAVVVILAVLMALLVKELPPTVNGKDAQRAVSRTCAKPFRPKSLPTKAPVADDELEPIRLPGQEVSPPKSEASNPTAETRLAAQGAAEDAIEKMPEAYLVGILVGGLMGWVLTTRPKMPKVEVF